MVHICFNESTNETLGEMIDENNLVCLPLHLSYGNIGNPLDYASRQSIYSILDSQYQSNIGYNIEKFRSFLSNSKLQATIWVSACSWDYCGLLHLLAISPGSSFSIVSDSTARSVLHTHEHLCNQDASSLSQLLPHARMLSAENIRRARQKWSALQNENAPLRVINHHSIRSVNSTYYDQLLTQYISSTPKRICYSIAELYAKHDRIEYEFILLAQIERLVEQGKLLALSAPPFTMRSIIYKEGR